MKNITTKLKNIKPVYLVAALVMIAVAVLTPMQKQITKLFSDAAETKTYLMGDVDLNGKLEPSDARTVLRVSVQLDELEGVKDGAVLPNDKAEPTKGQLADIDGDKRITPSDARAILRMSVMLDEQKTMKVEIPEETTEPITEPSSGDIETTNPDQPIHEATTAPPTTNKNEPTTTYEQWVRNKADEYIESIKYDYISFISECFVKVQEMIRAGASDAEIKQYVQDFKAECDRIIAERELTEPSTREEPSTYWTGEHNEICMWCGKERKINQITGERSCYCIAWVTDMECPGCGQYVKAMTQHVCKEYWDYIDEQNRRMHAEQENSSFWN